MLTRQILERFGAGEGNRTLVISLEVPCGCCDFKARSDKSTIFRAIEPERLIRFVRTFALSERKEKLGSFRDSLLRLGSRILCPTALS